MSALTLVEAAKLSRDPIASAVIEQFARESDILRVLPFQNISGGSLAYNREGALASAAFRGVNEAYTASKGSLDPRVDRLAIAGGDLDVDRFIVQTQGEDVRGAHELLKVKGLAHAITTKIVKGDNTSDPREFDGLQSLLGSTVAGQVLSNNTASGGGALSLAKLDALIDAVDNPTHLLMSKAMRRRFNAAARTTTVGGYVTYDKDEFGAQITMYQGLPIVVPYANNGGTEPLAFDEAHSGGGSANGTSIYCLSLGVGRLVGIQNGGMDVRDLGELDDQPVFRTRVEWYVGLSLQHSRAAARLRDITDAAIVV
jgi:hypothetical protein